jgi:signal transduction histidine kinase
MSVELDNWLTEHRELLLPRWISSLCTTTAPSNGGRTTELTGDDHDSDTPFASLPEHEVENTLISIYEGLVEAARGDLSTLEEYLHGMIEVNGNKHGKLPDLLTLAFHLRRQAWDILQQDLSDPSATFALMGELDTLLEHTVKSLAHYWETSTETEISERISQAEFIAESMAAAIEQADRTALQLSSLNLASQRLSASLESTEKLIDQVGTTLLELMGAAHIAIWLPEERPHGEMDEDAFPSPDVTLYIARRWGNEETPLDDVVLDTSQSNDLVRRAFTRASIFLKHRPDPSIVGDWHQSGCGVLALPLMVKEYATGVICLQDPDPEERFSRSQQDMARALVNHAAVALENARLYNQIRKFNSELEQLVERRTSELQAEKDRLGTIHEISTEISSTLDLDNLLQTSLAALARITYVEYGSIMLLESDTGHLVNRAVLGHKNVNTFTRFPLGSGIAGWVAQHKQPTLVDDIGEDERWIPLPLALSDTPGKQQGSMVAVPLVAHSEILGVLILSHSQPGYFNEDHLRLLTASAGAIAIGINNANMYNTIFEGMERSSELLHRQQMETSKMEAILQSLSDGVLVCDTYGEILSANPAAGRILQRDITDLFMGTTLHDVLEDVLGAQRTIEMPLQDLLSTPLMDLNDEPRIFETTVEMHLRVVSLTLGPVLKEDNELIGALLLMHDITREVEAERLKTEFIGTMSHELRTPMTAIKGFTQLLAMGGLGPVNDTQREFLSTIQNNAERMISMINDVLDITKIETGSIDLELRPIHLAESLSGVVSELQTLITSREHNLTMSIPGSLPLVRADTTRLHQILHNILSNAVKYTPQGGEIQIEACEVDIDDLPEKVRSRLTRDRRYVRMDVSDTGVGISSNEIELIFERFYRTENQLKIEAGGTGLGLSLVKPLIELLGGCIWVESVVGEGSTFSFILPAVG